MVRFLILMSLISNINAIGKLLLRPVGSEVHSSSSLKDGKLNLKWKLFYDFVYSTFLMDNYYAKLSA